MRGSIARLLGGLTLMLGASAALADSAVVRLTVQPAALTLDGSRDAHCLLVTAHTADGQARDVTREALFSSGNPSIAEVFAGGACRAKNDGETVITAQFAGQSATVTVKAIHAKDERGPSFLNDFVPLMTRLGCNQGACHGKGAGQNGFRLSLRGYAPELDHQWLTREFSARRIDRTVPETSLLLQKPLGQSRHEGGKLINVGSREYLVLLDWLRSGMPGPNKTDPQLRSLELLPVKRVMRVDEEQQLLVQAEFSDGSKRDVTWLTRFNSNDAGMASVDARGRVRVLRQGETAIRASFQTLVGVAIITCPFDQPVPKERLAQRNNVIDEHVFNKLGAMRIEPSELCGDSEFLRRAYLDTIGSLPSADETRRFLDDKQADKRARMIDDLLQRPEFVDYWALQLSDLFQNRKERDHDVRGTKGVRAFHSWLRQQVARNRPWDELVREVITAAGKTTDRPEVGYYLVTVGESRGPQSEVVASVAQALLGTRIGCARCHNHPLERYTQDDYYHFAAFFSRMWLERRNPEQGASVLHPSPKDANQAKQPAGVSQPRTGAFLRPQPLDRSAVTLTLNDDPRIALAAWMTDPKNENFSGAMVNRLVKHFLGVGLVEPVDDLRASNPPSNPELWQALNREFVAHKFDLKHVIRLLLNSRTYQLSSATRPGNAKETRFYSHYYVRRLPAEVLLDALSQCTGVPDQFSGYPLGMRAVQLPDSGLKSYFLSLFGRSERVTACACERNGEVTMPQLLNLQNGDSIIGKVRAPSCRLTGLLKAAKTDDAIIDELFLATLARRPRPAELPKVKKALTDGPRDEVLRDLFWALLNSKEFCFNH